MYKKDVRTTADTTRAYPNISLFQVTHQVPVVQKADTCYSIHQINRYLLDSIVCVHVCFANTYPLDSDLSCE